jgi:acyl-CoA synthetase (AMP-forming)/AMP-acid ligase II
VHSGTNAGVEVDPARAQWMADVASWHRMGDVGYLDAEGRFWYCGRKSQRVETRNGPLYTERIEPMFSTLPGVRRAALVGVGPTALKKPFVVVEPIDPSIARGTAAAQKRQSELIANWYDIEPRLHSLWYAEHGYILLAGILFHPSLPVDIRHNSKINREALGVWAARRTDAAGLPLNPDP